jgi:hypothetical protein
MGTIDACRKHRVNREPRIRIRPLGQQAEARAMKFESVERVSRHREVGRS